MADSKHAGGRPLIFQSVEELQTKIEAYFWACDNRTKEVATKFGAVSVLNPEPYTMSGLAYSLGIDRRSLLNYSNKEEFFPTIKKARDLVEMDVEKRMNDNEKFTPGLIFNAKNNFGWIDKTEVEQSGAFELNIGALLDKVYGQSEDKDK